MERVRLSSSDGRRIAGILHKPPQHSTRGVVVVHGYFSSKEGGVSRYTPLLAEAGMYALRIDLAGHGESEGDIATATVSDWIEDVEAALDLLDAQGCEELCLVGSSMGGLVCLATAHKHPHIERMALRAPVSDLPRQWTERYGEEAMRRWKQTGSFDYPLKDGGSVALNHKVIEDAARHVMTEQANAIVTPTLILHGDADEMVPLHFSEELVRDWDAATLQVIRGADHHLSIDGSYDAANEALVAWFRKGSGNTSATH